MIEKIDIDTLIQEATALYQQTKFSEAQTIYQHILTIEPDHFDALRLLGLLFAQIKKYTQAVETLTKALKVNPNHARSCSNLGIALKGLEQFDDALASFDKALSLNPDFADAYINRGNVLKNLKRFDEALASFDKALSLKPDYAEAYYNRGNILLELNRLDEALASFDKAIKFKPDYPDAFNNRGVAFKKLKRFDEALASYDQAIVLNPNQASVFNNLGNTLQELKFLDKALNNYDKAIAIKSDYAEAHFNRGNALQELDRYDEAVASYDQAIAIKSDYAEAYSNRGVSLKELNRYEEALTSYNQAIAIKPNYIDANLNLSLCNLMLGNFNEGWQGFEWRWLDNKFDSKPLKSNKPAWDFKKTDRRLFVWAEQGIGDHIFFGRLLSELIEDVPNLLVQVDKRLIPIFNRSLPKIKFYPTKNLDPQSNSRVPESDYDIHVSMGSLCQYLRNDEKDFDRSQCKFLKDNEIKTLEIKKDLLDLTPSNNKICGISWRSVSKNTGVNKTISLKYFINALDLEGYTFVSLQYGKTKGEIKEVKDEFGIDIISYEKVDNFLDIYGLASLIQACDVVISIDNVTCQLAGALGKKIHILLTKTPYWTWVLGRRHPFESNDSLWYPLAKLYRQEKLNDWDVVFHKLNNELKMTAR